LPYATPEEVREKVKSIKDLFEGQGGLILGPSHYITNDTPTENILAIYR
jgi:uroporphyrinogen-III decarboxylase